MLKDFINYFREVQASYESRAKGITKISQTLSTAIQPSDFLKSGGILDTNTVLRDYQKDLYSSSENAAKIQSEIINSLNSLRVDLSFKIKEIKALSPDFKNNVEKEKETTRKEIIKLTEALTALDSNPQSSTGKTDPYIVKLGLQKQLRRQIDEENYLHKVSCHPVSRCRISKLKYIRHTLISKTVAVSWKGLWSLKSRKLSKSISSLSSAKVKSSWSLLRDSLHPLCSCPRITNGPLSSSVTRTWVVLRSH